MKKTKLLAIASVCAALCVAIMAIGVVLDVLDLSLAILAGLIVAVVATEFSDRWGWAVYGVAGLLSLLLPNRVPGALFLLFCGWYPILQKKIQMLRPVVSRIVKEAVFNAALALYLVLEIFVLRLESAGWVTLLTVVFANILFVMYDYLLDRLILFYIVKLRERLKIHKLK